MSAPRVAFLTNEFAGEPHAAGGLASYLERVSRALRAVGCEVEVLTLSYAHPPGSFERDDGVRVERVAFRDPLPLRLAARATRLHPRLHLRDGLQRLRESLGLAAALARRERESRFDFVQSTNCGLAGLFVPRRAGRPHLLRLSSNRELCFAAQRKAPGLESRLLPWLERRCARRADLVYAPSRRAAEQARRSCGVPVQLLRPPAFLEVEPDKRPPADLPPRYLVHFGRLGRIKGSDVLAEALPRAWAQEPDLQMVWAGHPEPGVDLDALRSRWGDRARQVQVRGPLEKGPLYALVRGAVASVCPSRVDNLPNTAIESLLLGVPVIGTRGASVDELIEDGRSGALVPREDPDALARALVDAWSGRAPWLGAGFERPGALEALEPERAARALLRLAGVPPPGATP